MKVSEAAANRMSVRAFKDTPVPMETILNVLEKAARAPSGGNLQPWRISVLSPEKLIEFNALMERRLGGEAREGGDHAEYQVYPPNLHEPYRTVRFEVGEDMYGLLDIGRDDKPKRLEWFANNFRFFGAPAALFCFVDRKMGPPQWSDLGMFLQTVMLLLQEEGIDTCAQECWSMYPKTVADFCQTPDEWMLFCGMAVGYRDETHPVNQLNSKRLTSDQWLSVVE